MRIREHWPTARSRQRRREFAAVFAQVPAGSLGDMLEIGSGDGFVASMLEPLGKSLVATDPTPGRSTHARHLPRLRCSATDLPFADASFDFICSTSVLEHVKHREAAMAELHRVLRPDGTMVHMLPSPTWKLLQLAFYYPHLALSGIEYIGASKQLPAPAAPETDTWHDPQTKQPWWRELWRGMLPRVHGEYPDHFRELFGFRARAWARMFERTGFELRTTLRMPLYSGYGFGLERLRRVGERCGLSAHTAFVLTHRDARPTWRWPTVQP
jgi:SAM-dependent methyltransferase